MGLIRATLCASTCGLVSYDSKKQQSAKAMEKNTKATAQASAQAADLMRQANRIATDQAKAERERAEVERQRTQREHEFRYETDPVYRVWSDEKGAREAEQQAREAAEKLVQEAEFHARLRERRRIEAEEAVVRKAKMRLAWMNAGVVSLWIWFFWVILPAAAMFRVAWSVQSLAAKAPGVRALGRPVLEGAARKAWAWLKLRRGADGRLALS